MRKILLCILLVFILGCVPVAEELTGLEPGEIEEGAEELVEEGLSFVDKIIPNEYRFVPGASLTILGKKVTVKDITTEYETIIQVDGTQKTIKTTQTPEYINGLNVVATELNFDGTGLNTYVILKITEFKLGEDEYLLFYKDKMEIDGKKVELDDVYTDNKDSISVGVQGVYARIIKGETKVLNGIEVTNVRTNPRAISSEKYAVLKLIVL